MASIGYSDLKNVVRMPGNWDQSYLAKWQLKDGTPFSTIVSRLGAALVLFNRGLTGGYFSRFLRSTTDMTLSYGVGTTGRLSPISEYGRPDPIYGASTGHMLPMKDYGGALGWTYLALRRAHAGKLDEDVRALVQQAEDTWEHYLLDRMFKSVAETVGTTGKSVPLADAGVADAEYVPPTFQGKSFLSTHTHYLCKTDDKAGREAAVKAMGEHLLEHGIMPPWDLLVPEVDLDDWAAIDYWKKPERGYISTQGIEVRGTVDEQVYAALIEVPRGYFLVRPVNRLPTNYAGAFKAYGYGDTRNSLAVRYEDGYPLGLSLVAQIEEYPLQDAVAMFTFGFGIGNRLNGAACFFDAGGVYADPTIS